MTNAVYQKTIAALEEVLAPRIVSRSMQEGLAQLGKTPESVELDDIETILKSQIYRQLQITMPVHQAKETVVALIDALKADASGAPGKPQKSLAEQQREALEGLQLALRPFNLYFEWPETQKLRSQLQLVAVELEAGRDASKLITSARANLKALEQKLEDHLVAQARELGELEAALASVKSLGGHKVRRLENLLGHIAKAQHARQLATAELERARKLATELRKLLESSMAEGEEDESASAAELTGRLLRLDLQNEAGELSALESDFSILLSYRPDLGEKLAAMRQQHGQQRPLGEALARFRSELHSARQHQREVLLAELEQLSAELDALGTEEGAVQEARQALQVTKDILATTLPPLVDMQQLRSLCRWLGERSNAEAARGDGVLARKRALLEELTRLEEAFKPYRGLEEANAQALARLLDERRAALEAGTGGLSLKGGWQLLEQLQVAHTVSIGDFDGRLQRALAAYAPVSRLNSDDSAAVGRTLEHLRSQQEAFYRVSPAMQAQLVKALAEAEATIKELERQLDATRAVAGQLVEGGVLDDILGLFGDDAGPLSQPAPATTSVNASRVSEVISALQAARGVAGAASYARNGELLAGELPSGAAALGAQLHRFDRDLHALGRELKAGRPQLVTLATSRCVLALAWQEDGCLAVAIDTPPLLGPILDQVREAARLLNAAHDPAVA